MKEVYDWKNHHTDIMTKTEESDNGFTHFKISDKKNFDFFCDMITKLHFFGENNEHFQLFYDKFLFIKWKNIKNQVEFLNLLINNKEISENSKFSLNNYQGQKISKESESKTYISSKNNYL